MITATRLADARVLVVGEGELVSLILENLVSYGVIDITVIDASTATDEKNCKFIKQDPEELIAATPSYFTSFHIVLCVNQPRSFEVALSDLRWPRDCVISDADLPMIVMRHASNICKMRCQYRELQVDGSKSVKFVSLPMELLPWTDEKRALVSSTIKNEFKPDQNPVFQAYFTAALAIDNFRLSNGSWPGIQEAEKVKALVKSSESGSQPTIENFIDRICEGGYTAVRETTILLARIVVLDTVKLLTANGQPINNTNLEDIIQIVAKN